MRVEARLVIAALCLAPAALAAQQPAQPSVVEAARQARQAQKRAPQSVRLYTNDNLPRGSGGRSVAGAGATSPPSTKPSAKEAEPAAGPKGPAEPEERGAAYWHRRFAETRAKLAQAESELATLERGMGQLQLQYYDDPNKALMQGYTRSDIREQQEKIAAKQTEAKQLREQLEKLEDELRRSGGDPGWAR